MRIKTIQDGNCRVLKIHYEYDLDSTPIGEGGMGVVYRGRRIDERTGISTDVAIKILNDNLPDEVYSRAEREASIQIKHTNLVEMYGMISEYETDRFGMKRTHHYVISEFLHGVDLSELLHGKFDNSDGTENFYAKALYAKYIKDRKESSIEIIRSISSGVLALHDAGYIHRDIDPSNIMVTDSGNIKLIDFGIAKNLNRLGTNDRLTTSTGKFIGKAEYASPELVLGDVKHHNYTTDIYALGILLFRLLAGKLPFNGTQYEVLQKQLKSKVPVGRIEDAAMAKVVKKATEKNQAGRYASVAEFRVAIDAAARQNRKQMPGWVRGIAASLAVLLAGGLLWHYWPSIKPEAATEGEPSLRSQFNQALALLNSNEPDSVKTGFEQMKTLARAEYDSAKVELGLTYLPYLKANSLADTLANPILRRRYHLGLSGTNDADSVIGYLKSSTNLPPEASYLLGCTYYQTGNEAEALTMFHQAKYSIDKATEVGHGYESKSLKQIVIDNISALQN